MIASVITFMQTYLLPLGGGGVFLATIIEEVIAPIPSALVVLTAAFFLPIHGGWSPEFFSSLFFIVVIPSALGVAIGSLAVYGLAYVSGKPAIEKWGKWLGVSWQDIEKAQEKLKTTKKDEITILILRAIPLVPSVVISAFCGVTRMALWSYLIVSFIGAAIRAFILGLIGSKVGELYFLYAQYFERFEKIVLTIVVLVVVTFVLFRIKKQKKVSI
ncbi:MAG: VTT domain-containing protein [Patescibacteria group bacterium]